MRCTEGCGRWAQWKASTPEKDANGTIVKLKTVAILCGEHKSAMQKSVEAHDPKPDVRFNFVGAIPDGSYRP